MVAIMRNFFTSNPEWIQSYTMKWHYVQRSDPQSANKLNAWITTSSSSGDVGPILEVENPLQSADVGTPPAIAKGGGRWQTHLTFTSLEFLSVANLEAVSSTFLAVTPARITSTQTNDLSRDWWSKDTGHFRCGYGSPHYHLSFQNQFLPGTQRISLIFRQYFLQITDLWGR